LYLCRRKSSARISRLLPHIREFALGNSRSKALHLPLMLVTRVRIPYGTPSNSNALRAIVQPPLRNVSQNFSHIGGFHLRFWVVWNVSHRARSGARGNTPDPHSKGRSALSRGRLGSSCPHQGAQGGKERPHGVSPPAASRAAGHGPVLRIGKAAGAPSATIAVAVTLRQRGVERTDSSSGS
jgi:hypothetical protein